MKGSSSGSTSKNPSARAVSEAVLVGVLKDVCSCTLLAGGVLAVADKEVVNPIGLTAMLANGNVRRLAGVMVFFAPMGGIAGVCKVSFMTVFAALGSLLASHTVSGATAAFAALGDVASSFTVSGAKAAFAPLGGIARVCRSALATMEECKVVSTTVLTALDGAIVSIAAVDDVEEATIVLLVTTVSGILAT